MVKATFVFLLILFQWSVGQETSYSDEIHKQLVEEGPVGVAVADIIRDSGMASIDQIRFQKVAAGGRFDELFSVEESTGIVRTSSRVDREAICPRAFECQAVVKVANRETFDVTIVYIEILDRNDNTPTFPKSHDHKKIPETTSLGKLFPIEEAVDNDHPVNGTKSYELVSQYNKFELRVTNDTESGTVDLNIWLTEEVDREDHFLYQLKIVATDGQGLKGETRIDIEIEDVNDNSPRFENETYTLNIPEDTPVDTSVLTLLATDADVGPNGLVTYRLSDKSVRRFGTLFELDPASGEFKLKRQLDYEDEQQYVLQALAEDGGSGGIAGRATIVVNVQDTNDNAPRITVEAAEGSGVISIEENSKTGSFVALMSAADPDSGDNGRVQCSLDNANFGIAHLGDVDYIISTKTVLDREDQESYEILIECHDFGSPQLATSRNITISINDINDHAPVFEHSQYNVSKFEGNAWNALVLTVKAIDSDASKEGQVTYSISEAAQGIFNVDPNSGEVRTQIEFDREEQDHYQFEVIATDSGDERKQGRCLVLLDILDVEDNPPRFKQASYVFSLAENLAPRTFVGEVEATDDDLSPHDEFAYYIDLHNSASLDFRVDSATGKIYTKRMLNRERISVYTVDVLAQDSNNPSVSARCSVSIYVTDKNDNAPIIDFPSPGNNTVTMSVDAKEGAIIARVRAHDIDLGPNQVLYYMISEGNEGGEFSIKEPTGEIILQMDAISLTKTAYDLVVMVRDSGSPAQIAVQTLTIILHETSAGPLPRRPTDSPEVSGRTEANSSAGLSQTTLTIIICVISGFLIIALILGIAIVFVRRRPKRTGSQTPMTTDTLWAQADSHGLDGPGAGKTEEKMSRDDSKLTEISDIILALDTEPMNFQSRVEQLEKHSPKSDLDGDSGCADLSNSGSSQGSNEDSEGSKRSSKASEAEAGSDLHVPYAVRQLVPNLVPAPMVNKNYHDPNNPDYGSLQRQRDRYPYEDDSLLRRTYSTPPKAKVPQGALAAARNKSNNSSIPRTLSNCSKKSVRFSDNERPETPRKHVTFADHDDVMSGSPERCKSPLETVSAKADDKNIAMSSFPQDGAYTTFVPLDPTSLSSLV